MDRLAGFALRQLGEQRLDLRFGREIGLHLRVGERHLLHRLVGRGGRLVLGEGDFGRQRLGRQREAAERKRKGERTSEMGHLTSSGVDRRTLRRPRSRRKSQPACVAGERARARGAMRRVSAKIVASVSA